MVKALFSSVGTSLGQLVSWSVSQSVSHLVFKWALETHCLGSNTTTSVNNDLSFYFHICKMGIIKAYLTGLLRGLNKTRYIKLLELCLAYSKCPINISYYSYIYCY